MVPPCAVALIGPMATAAAALLFTDALKLLAVDVVTRGTAMVAGAEVMPLLSVTVKVKVTGLTASPAVR